MIAPEGRGGEHGLRQIAMPKLSAPWRPLLPAIVRALRLEAFVETPLYAPEGARIVLHGATMRIWIDGLLCTLLTELHFRLLEILIPTAGNLVHSKEIAEHVAGASS